MPDSPPPGGTPEPDPDAPSPQQGLVAWILVIGAGSLASLLLGHAESALLFAGAGVLALAQASDAAVALASYRYWVRDSLPQASAPGRVVRLFVRSVVPGLGALTYLAIGSYASQLGEGLAYRFAAAWSYLAAIACLLLVSRPVADRVTRVFFRTGPVGRTRRLAARLAVIALLLPPPMQALHPEVIEWMRDSPTPLADPGALVAQLLGEVLIALAGVGWLVRRRWRATAERLGLGPLSLTHSGMILLGLVGAIALNAGMESLQHVAFPALWERDQEATRIIALEMTVATALLLGLSAGVGEEVLLRGALQPRMGILATSVIFACGHVQYSWFGMLTITLLGVLLGFVRRQTNTTAAIVVHMLYDVFAVLASRAG